MFRLHLSARLSAGLFTAALCAGLLAGCGGAASSAAAPEPTATPTVEEAQRAAANREILNIEDARKQAQLANRGAEYWQTQLDASQVRYIKAQAGMAGVVDPASDEEITALLDNTTDESGTSCRELVDSGKAYVVNVSFYVEYQPEVNYFGAQYPDGTNSVYVLVPASESDPCLLLSGWRSQNSTTPNIPELSDEARALKLNEWQYRMLTHQCSALAAAGITDFSTPADWTEEQLAYYLAARSRDSGPNPLGFLADYANAVLTIDFTTENDWSNNTRFVAADWPGTAVTADDLPATPDYTWEYETDGTTVTATGSVDGAPAVRYTFAIYPGTELKWDARTVCTGGQSL